MITRINYEVFSPAMKARLDPTYRRLHEMEQPPKNVELRRNNGHKDPETVLPFTTKTRAYGTYVERK